MSSYRNLSFAFIVFGLLLQLTACSSAPPTPITAPTHLLSHHAFQRVDTPIETPEQIFYLPHEVIQDVRHKVLRYPQAAEQQQALLKYIFQDENRDILEYLNEATLTATETLQQRVANCLSLTILAASLAEQVGFMVDFRDVVVPEYWISRSGSSLLNGHINLKLTPRLLTYSNQALLYQTQSYLIDFDRGTSQVQPLAKSVSKEVVIALFYNNKAADAMLADQDDLAFKYLQAALQQAPLKAELWNNLAVLYRKKQLFQPAEQLYLYSLQLEPENNNTWSNLALLYERTNRVAEAKVLQEKIARRRLQNPYYFVMLGHEALLQGQQQQAVQAFRRALQLQPKTAEAQFGLAQSYLALGDYSQAVKYLRAAGQNTVDKALQRRYHSKLEMLNAIALQTH
jgi:Flp pilus assembly protein TadD